LKTSFRGNKDLSKADQQTQVKELQTKMDTIRKQGVKMIKAKLSEMFDDEEMTLT